MKLSTSLILFTSAASTVSAGTTRSVANLLSQARRLEDANMDDAINQSEYAFLKNYDLKLLKCSTGTAFTNANGNTEADSVVFRLCPATSCSDDNGSGCKDGYGDFVVGLNTFVDNWIEIKKDSLGIDDGFKIEDYSECRQYKAQNNDGNQYYVGPTCSADETSVVLGFFSDNACTTVPDGVTFEEITNGWTLPFSSSPLITQSCETCLYYTNNGVKDISAMCIRLYEYSSSKCETKMQYLSANGADDTGCATIQELNPAQASQSKVGAAIGWTIFALVIVGAAGYFYATWWMKKKQSSGMASDGVMN